MFTDGSVSDLLAKLGASLCAAADLRESRSATDAAAVCLVLGGAGLIGSELTVLLRRLGQRVVVADVQSHTVLSRREGGDVRVVNLLDERATMRLFDAVRPTVVFHLAADMGGMAFISRRDKQLDITSNSHITRNVLQAIRAVGIVKLLMFASTACVYRECYQTKDVHPPLREVDHVYPRDLMLHDSYARSKLNDEEDVLSFGLQFSTPRLLVVRFHNVYGRGTWRGGREKAPMAALRKALVQAMTKSPREPYEGTHDTVRSYLHVEDACEAVVALSALLLRDEGHPRLVEHCRQHAVNVGSATPVMTDDLFRVCRDLVCVDSGAGSAGDAKCVAATVTPSEGCAAESHTAKSELRGVVHRTSDNSFLLSVLPHWRPREIREGLTQVLPWLTDEVKAFVARGGSLEDL